MYGDSSGCYIPRGSQTDRSLFLGRGRRGIGLRWRRALHKINGRGVDAEAAVLGRRSIIEDVAHVGGAPGAAHLGAHHA